MKLLNCLECHDIYQLKYESRQCRCGKSKANYIDEIWVEYSGPARILGIGWNEYDRSIKTKKFIPYQTYFEWFVINEGDHIRKLS